MKQNAIKMIALVATCGALFTACSKDDAPATVVTPVVAKTATNLVADPASTGNHYAFFSLETNSVIPFTDSATTKWDIAFKSTTIIINGGTSGPGAGGAFVQTGTTFNELATISADSTFRVDNVSATPAFAIRTGSGNGWYNYNASTNIISPIPGRLLIIRTATGKFAKVEITSYYKDAPATPTATDVARNFNFRFAYQPNGTKAF